MEYKKDFDKWNLKKKEINNSKQNTFFYERDIWWCSLGVNIDVEIDGKNDLFERPVLILKKINNKSAWIVPITSKTKDSYYRYSFKTLGTQASLSQIRNISYKRLLRRINRITVEEYSEILIRYHNILKNETPPRGEGESRSPHVSEHQ